MFALEKVPKILTLLHTFFLSLMMSILSLSCCGCKHGRLKSQFSPASILHLFSQFDLLLFSPTRGEHYTHAHTHTVINAQKREQGYSTRSEEGGFVGVRFFFCGEVFRSQPLCAMERVSDVQNNRGGKECYAQFSLHYYKNKSRKLSSLQCLMQESYGFFYYTVYIACTKIYII